MCDYDLFNDRSLDTRRLRSRVVGLKLPEGGFLDTKQFYILMDLFAEAYQRVVDEQPITCAATGKEFSAVIPPDTIVMDVSCPNPSHGMPMMMYVIALQFFCTPAMEAARKISKKPVKIHAWMSAQASFTIPFYAPKHWGGRGDRRPKIAEEVARSGRPLAEVAHEVRCYSLFCIQEVTEWLTISQILVTPTGSVYEAPGLPPMYDYEYKPQAVCLSNVQ